MTVPCKCSRQTAGATIPTPAFCMLMSSGGRSYVDIYGGIECSAGKSLQLLVHQVLYIIGAVT